MITRRSILTGTALAVATPAIANVSRIVGAAEQAGFRSQKFSGPAWYAFSSDGRGVTWVYYARRDDHPFIALSFGPDEDVALYCSHRAFDASCIGIVQAVDERGYPIDGRIDR